MAQIFLTACTHSHTQSSLCQCERQTSKKVQVCLTVCASAQSIYQLQDRLCHKETSVWLYIPTSSLPTRKQTAWQIDPNMLVCSTHTPLPITCHYFSQSTNYKTPPKKNNNHLNMFDCMYLYLIYQLQDSWTRRPQYVWLYLPIPSECANYKRPQQEDLSTFDCM